MRTKLEHSYFFCYAESMSDLPRSPNPYSTVRGRGALENPGGRFERLNVAVDEEAYADSLAEEENAAGRQIGTEVFRDASKSIVTTNDSPDVGMEASVNPYRGCEHGCIYCFARPTHEYLGLSAGLDFETKIFAKPDAPELLKKKLSSPHWVPKVLMLSGVTDCYQPIERSLKITRGCFEVLAAFRNPAVVVTKNHLVTRDIDIFKQLAEHNAVSINLSITTLDGKLARLMEPRASRPGMRLKAVGQLANAGIRVGIMIGPVLPGLTEHEIPSILKEAASAGAGSAYYTMLRLPHGVKDLFQTWLDEHYPDRKSKILNRLRDMYKGKLYEADFNSRITGNGVYAEHIAQTMAFYKKKYGLDKKRPSLSTASFRRNAYESQMSLF
jgi:DNA repair photolyase